MKPMNAHEFYFLLYKRMNLFFRVPVCDVQVIALTRWAFCSPRACNVPSSVPSVENISIALILNKVAHLSNILFFFIHSYMMLTELMAM